MVNQTYITDKIFDMKLYHMFQQQEFRMKYYPYIQQVIYKNQIELFLLSIRVNLFLRLSVGDGIRQLNIFNLYGLKILRE